MELIRGLHNIQPKHHGCIATIGNFDGIHLGHQQLIKQLNRVAKNHRLPSCIITFDPLPHEFFVKPEQSQSRLTHFREKFHTISDLGADRMLMLKFNQALANLDAKDFIQKVLINSLGIKHLIVGDDFQFGKGRSGNYELLQQEGKTAGFSVSPTETYCIDSSRVSSTRIRQHLHAGELAQAEQLLNRPYAMEGRVVYGRQLGRTLGYPTANILLKRRKTPLHGIFVVEVSDEQGKTYPAMASLGERPTVEGAGKTLLEAHLFDFDGDLYGQHLKTTFLHKIREEEKFDSLEALTAAIASDEKISRHWFENNTTV